AAVLLPHAAMAVGPTASDQGPFQATGTRVGEVDQTSAIVWTRLTKHAARNNDGVAFDKDLDPANDRPPSVPVDNIEGACQGMAGRVRVRYGVREDMADAVQTDWVAVDKTTDFIHQFKLSGLEPDSTYRYVAETASPDDAKVRSEFHGRFSTA